MPVPARRDEFQPRSLSDIFNHFSRESAELFPSLKGRFIVTDTNEKIHHGRDSVNTSKAGYRDSVMDTFLRKELASKTLQTQASSDNRLNLAHIIYNEPVAPEARPAVPLNSEKEILFTLDHELAHLVIRLPAMAGENKQFQTSMGEAVADAYAAIRHYQRYGMESDYQAVIMDPWARAAGLGLHGDTDHFTTTMHQEILRLKDKIDYEHLTLNQTVELARRFAMDFTPPSSVVNRLYDKLAPVRAAYFADPESSAWINALEKVTLDPKLDSYGFRMCKLILEGYLDGRTDAYGASARLEAFQIQSIRQKLAVATEKHDKDGITYNLTPLHGPANNNSKPTRQPRPKSKNPRI